MSDGEIFTKSMNTKVFAKTPIFIPVGSNFPCSKGMKFDKINKICLDLDECASDTHHCSDRNISLRISVKS